jgi:diguanylate cyclase (GGDEF)-like protein/PAS domain S-box-containing protein
MSSSSATVVRAASERLAAAAGDLDRLLTLIAQEAAGLLDEGSVLSVVSPDGDTIATAAVFHPEREMVGFLRENLAFEPCRLGRGLTGTVAARRVPAILAGDALAAVLDPRSDIQELRQRHPIRALIVVPLVAYGELMGTLGVVRMVSDVPYSGADLEVLERFAGRAAHILAGARTPRLPLGFADYEALFQQSPEGVLFSSPDGRILAANPAACRILGRSEAAICCLGRDGLLNPDDPRVREGVRRREVTGRVHMELSMHCGDGTSIIADLSSTTFTTAPGVVRSCVTFRDVSEQVALQEQVARQSRQLEEEAIHDVLSGLLNRRGFMQAAQTILALADRQRVPVHFIFCDLNKFKDVNDRYGHQVGDEVLARVGASIASSVRAVDQAARLGGDEFVILLFDSTEAGAESLLERVRASMEALRQGGPEVSFSAGVQERPPGSTIPLDDLLHQADQRMYARKRER